MDWEVEFQMADLLKDFRGDLVIIAAVIAVAMVLLLDSVNDME